MMVVVLFQIQGKVCGPILRTSKSTYNFECNIEYGTVSLLAIANRVVHNRHLNVSVIRGQIEDFFFSLSSRCT